MSSIIYINPVRRKDLVRRWKHRIFVLDEKLKNLSKKAQISPDLSREVGRFYSKFRNEFSVVFFGDEKTIVNAFDVKYWNERNVNRRIKELSLEVERLSKKVHEKMKETEVLEKKYASLNKYISEYDFLIKYKFEMENLKNLPVAEKVQKIIDLSVLMEKDIRMYEALSRKKKILLKKAASLDKNTFDEGDFDFLDEVESFEAVKDLGEFEKKLNKLENFIKEKNRISDFLDDVKDYSIDEEIKKIDEFLQSPSKKRDKKFELILQKLYLYNEKEAKRIENLDVPDEYKLKEIKVVYQQERLKEYLQSRTKEILEEFKGDEEFETRFEKRLKESLKNLNEREFYDILYEIDEYKALRELNKKRAEEIKKQLEKLGYVFEKKELEFDEVGYIKTPDRNKIKYRFDKNGEVSFVYVALKGADLNEYEKNLLKESVKKWCNDYDKIKASLGFEIDEEYRSEIDIENIIFEEEDEEKGGENWMQQED